MLAQFDSAQEQLQNLRREIEGQVEPSAYVLGYWRELATDLLNSIYESAPQTRTYVVDQLAEADRSTLLGIIEEAQRFKPPTRIALAESTDTAYFAALVNWSIARSWFFRGATILVVVMIGTAIALMGFEIRDISTLSQDIAREVKEEKEKLAAAQRDMQLQVQEARNIRDRMKEETAGLETTLIGIEKEVAGLIDRFGSVKKILAQQLQDLNEVQARWKIERAVWDEEILKLKSYFTTQKENFERDAKMTLANLTPLVDQGRHAVEILRSLRENAESADVILAEQLTQARASVSLAGHAAESAEAISLQLVNLREGVGVKVTAATSAAESAISSANVLLGRLDTSRNAAEAALSDSDEKQARLNDAIEFWDSSHDKWLAKLSTGEGKVSEASTNAIDRIKSLTDDHRETLDRRLAKVDTVVAEIEKGELAAADLLRRMRERDDSLHDRENETRATLDKVNETLTGLQRELEFITALTEKIEGRRTEAETELDALLAERPPMTVARLWQTMLSSIAVTTTVIISSIAALLAVVALAISLIRRT